MNVYDFDKTIYSGDSSIDFYLFCLKRHKKIILLLPKQVWSFVKFKIGKISKEKFKEAFFSFLIYIPDIDNEVKCFWNKNKKKICNWYLNQKRENDLIISASPQFLLEELLTRIQVKNLICSKVDKQNGKFMSANCYGIEKLNRYKKEFGNEEIECFYSDSISDYPVAQIAKTAYLVRNKKKCKWSNKS